MEREVGGGIGMGYTCKPMAVSFQCMTKSTTIKKRKKEICLLKQQLKYLKKKKRVIRTFPNNQNEKSLRIPT